ncbi:MAG: adenine deaminase [Spirochaetaceae bacterium]|nr:MAG: adenine deaminase [Spirochaetaceae bacterium]
MSAAPADVGRTSHPAILYFNARIVDVILGSVYRGWFLVRDGRFQLVEEGDPPAHVTLDSDSADSLPEAAGSRRADLAGAVVHPGLLDIHMHIESSLLTPRRFAEAVLPWGTTTILQDPHEIANVLGAEGVRWMVAQSQGLPLRIYSAVSSCVPATTAPLETPNALLRPDEVGELATLPGVLALGEMMDYHGIINGDSERTAMVNAGLRAGLTVEGHVPSLSGPDLSRYIAAGIRSDHTLMNPDKIREELRKGLTVMIQEKSLTPEVVVTVQRLPDRSRVVLITDDVMPNRLRTGHMSRIVSLAGELGWDPVDAIASATIRPAVYLGLRDLGAIAPGFRADFVVCDELLHFPPRSVFVSGAQVAADGAFMPAGFEGAGGNDGDGSPDGHRARPPLVRFGVTRIPESYFRLMDSDTECRATVRVIETNTRNTVTTLCERRVTLRDGVPVNEPDLTLAVVISRAELSGTLRPRGTVCLFSGLGLTDGAFATSLSHDTHNVFVVGRSPAAMADAANAVLKAGGGMAVSTGETAVTAGDPASDRRREPLLLPLPIAALLSDEPVAEVGARFDELEQRLRALGMGAVNPILLLTILPLTVSPFFKISDLGIVDVEARRVLPPVVPE